jgi:hypothetical protein
MQTAEGPGGARAIAIAIAIDLMGRLHAAVGDFNGV